MKPVAIFRHSPTEGPGYFATHLDRAGVPWQLFAVDENTPLPRDLRQFSGLALMGGPMSVNDDLPWIAPELELIRRAVRDEVPVLGHCLGGQLMSKALGGVVSRNAVKEIGWGRVTVAPGAEARRWFGDVAEFLAFHWHGETFSIPRGAQLVASSEHCPNQAFVLERHLGMQAHVEMTPQLVRSWCEDWHREVTSLAARVPSVQTPEEMERDLAQRIAALNCVAARLYDRWMEGLAL